jgi:hypothetical protein
VLPILYDKRMLALTTTDQIKNVDQTSIRSFFKLYKRTSKTLSGDFHIGSSLPFPDLKGHMKFSTWLESHGYNVTLCECQTSDMVKIGFLSCIQGFTYRDDIVQHIMDLPVWKQDPFHFRLYYDTFITNAKGKMAYILMVDVNRPNIEKGIAFFQQSFDGTLRNSTNGIAYPFFTLYKNTYSEEQMERIIYDSDHHTEQVSVVTLYGLHRLDTLVCLKQNVTIRLCHLILGLPDPGTSNGKLFLQVERQSSEGWHVCAFYNTDASKISPCLSTLSKQLQRYILPEDVPKVFCCPKCAITINGQAATSKKGRLLSTPLLPVPEATVTHTHKVLGNLANRSSKCQKDVTVRCSSPVAESSTNYGYASPHQATPTTPSASHHPAMATPNSVMTATSTTPPSPPPQQRKCSTSTNALALLSCI